MMFRKREDQVIKVGAFHSLLKLLERLMAISAVLALLAGVQLASAAPAPIRGHMEPVVLDSGPLDNWWDVSAVVFSEIVDLGPDVPWVRIIFSDANLPPGSAVRVTSLLDGESQTLDAQELARWYNGTAFFNGSAVEIELIAGPRSTGNLIRIAEIFAGDLFPERADFVAGPPDDIGGVAGGICGGVDDRTQVDLTAKPLGKAVGRLISGGKKPEDTKGNRGSCTAFIIDDPSWPLEQEKLVLTAGHCFGVVDQDLTNPWVLQFDVPKSNGNCTMRHPATRKQFVVDGRRVRSTGDAGPGNDYAIFACVRNQETNKTPYQEQGQALRVASSVTGPYNNVQVLGYGVDGGSPPSNPCGSDNRAYIGPGANGVLDSGLNDCPGVGDDVIVGGQITTGADARMDTVVHALDVCLYSQCACGAKAPSTCDPGDADAPMNKVLQGSKTGTAKTATFGGKDVVRFNLDVCGGNSGGPLIDQSTNPHQVIGIVSHAFCYVDTQNFATPINHQGLTKAIADEKLKTPRKGVCEKLGQDVDFQEMVWDAWYWCFPDDPDFDFNRIDIHVGKPDGADKLDFNNRPIAVCKENPNETKESMVFKKHEKDVDDNPHHEVWSADFPKNCIGSVDVYLQVDPARLQIDPNWHPIIKQVFFTHLGPPKKVPTLPQWGLIGLVALTVIGGAIIVGRRRTRVGFGD